MKKNIQSKCSFTNIKILVSIIIISMFSIFIFNNTIVFASSTNSGNSDFWEKATVWFFGDGSENVGVMGQDKDSNKNLTDFLNTTIDMVNVIGTVLIFLATAALGFKYIIGSISEKAVIKENMISLLVACVFFFGWSNIWNMLQTNGAFFLFQKNDSTYIEPLARVFAIITNVFNFLGFGAIIYIGVRYIFYIFAGAEAKATLKAKSIYFIMGIIMLFATNTLLSYISKVVIEATGP